MEGQPAANRGYASAQLVKAWWSSGEQAPERAQQWAQVLDGMLAGTLDIGSRTPAYDTPPWVSLEVAHGGFATGRYAAGGQLQPHELDVLASLEGGEGEGQGRERKWEGVRAGKKGKKLKWKAAQALEEEEKAARSRLNVHWLSKGWQELEEMLQSGEFRLQFPEEGALLVLLWLLDHGETQRATHLFQTILPFFDRIRFYPIPAPASMSPSGLAPKLAHNPTQQAPAEAGGEDKAKVGCQPGVAVSVATVGDVVKGLKGVKAPSGLQVMREVVGVWLPLKDRLVDLFLETVVGPTPAFQRDESGSLVRDAETKSPVVEGGWPCKVFPATWQERAVALLAECVHASRAHSLSKKHADAVKRLDEESYCKSDFGTLVFSLDACAEDPRMLSPRDLGRLRRVLASHLEKHGTPQSHRRAAMRAMQAASAAQPLHQDVAHVVARRLCRHYPDVNAGAADLGVVLAPLSLAEAAQVPGATPGFEVPPSVRAKAERCLEAPLGTLLAKRLVSSSETLASILPRISAYAMGAAIQDPGLQRVYRSVYQAFRERRSLLLLKLASQVWLSELPWVQAIEPWLKSEAYRGAARLALAEAATSAMATWPHAQLPNKLVKELQALAAAAKASEGDYVPLVEELAVDIFQGAFVEKFLRAAQVAGRLLKGSLYERYYGLDYERVLALDDLQVPWEGAPPVSPGFAAMCEDLAGVGQAGEGGGGYYAWRRPAENGMILEQAAILTTHNLAALVARLAPQLNFAQLARRCLEWIARTVRAHNSPSGSGDSWRISLHVTKASAYAWRNLVFYLSLESPPVQAQFLDWAQDFMSRQPQPITAKLRLFVQGLRDVADGLDFSKKGHGATTPNGGRRFLGWHSGCHGNCVAHIISLGPDSGPPGMILDE